MSARLEFPIAKDAPVVFYDGECGLCNRSVQFVLDHDPGGRVLLAPLQGETFRERCPEAGSPDLRTVLLLEGGRLFDRSEAVLRIMAFLKAPWPMLGRLGRLVPGPLRDWVYDRVALRRYRWFGPADSCRLPTPGERARLLP